ncbi:LAME_0B00298g1_1 [Lachancea meyersii CBS 8951]|uniref:LAME_0B00298g1_1 n=1 Tax=Lachancea meyersii CBS 8951 TaxID=1266667 RepID=A0A1G4ISF9_9SACH|nr:LAME_0B00298g1_1 [Lachancea meyersii CBS 8951]
MAAIRYRSGTRSSNGEDIVRRIEKRSKNGCLTCRQRRKKCDEVFPNCGGCVKNNLNCEWPSSFVDLGADRRNRYSFVHLSPDDLSTTLSKRRPKKAISETSKDHLQVTSSKRGSEATESLAENEQPPALRKMNNENSYKKSKQCPCLEAGLQVYESSECRVNRMCATGIESTIKTAPTSANAGTKHHTSSFFDLQLDSYLILEKSCSNFPAIAPHNQKRSDGTITSANTQFRLQSPKYDFGGIQLSVQKQSPSPELVTEKYRELLDAYDKGKSLLATDPEDDEELLFYTCINKFIPNLGTQYTHPLLTTCATFVPQVENNTALKEIFLCCGATYLAWYDETKFSTLSDELYESSRMLIEKELKSTTQGYSESWMLASFLLLCLRCKMASSGTVDECVKCLSEAYLVIKNTISSRYREQKRMATGLQNLAYEIENKFMANAGEESSKAGLVLQPFERMYIESFIYNYSVAILFATDIVTLPSPFSIFKELGDVLKRPIYYCYFEWMNNPVLGPALDAFEILAKVSYIARLPMPLSRSSDWVRRARQLHSMAFYYTAPVLSPTLRSQDLFVYENAKVSSKVGNIVAKSSYLLVSKILRYNDFDIWRQSVLKVRSELFEAYSSIPLESKTWGILLWSLVITGCFSVTSAEKSQIVKYLLNVGAHLHHQNTSKMRSFLENAWLLPVHERLGILFDRDQLSQLAP